MSEGETNWTCNCWSCGLPIAGWWEGDAKRMLYDAARDDAAYERWRDTPCPRCGKTPRAREGAATP